MIIPEHNTKNAKIHHESKTTCTSAQLHPVHGLRARIGYRCMLRGTMPKAQDEGWAHKVRPV